ncbi:MAG: OmpA family protein [Pseudomonadota bacterium]|nr:OmpA family protein [Pseudomonadota bacterium]
MKPYISLALSALLVGCTTTGTHPNGQPNENNSAVIGAVLGAALGGLAGSISADNADNKRKNALIGAGIGALAGGVVGNYMEQQEALLNQRLQGTGVEVERQGDNILLNMPNSITFDFNKAQVKPDFYGVIRNISDVLNGYPSTYVDVIGHTDSVGSEDYNEALSFRRAQAVSDIMMGDGVLGSRLVVRGMGERLPVASNDTQEGRAQNRRVEILIAPHREGF